MKKMKVLAAVIAMGLLAAGCGQSAEQETAPMESIEETAEQETIEIETEETEETTAQEENLPEGLSLIPLPGHSDGQFGLRTDDDVIFLADSLVGENILKKYRISHIFDVRRYLETLKKVKDLEAKLFVPTHGTVCSDIRPLAEANIQNTLSVMEDILSLCAEKISFDDCMARIFEKYGLPFDMVQYSLNSCTVKSMLSYLHEEGKVEIVTEDNHLYWRSYQEL